MASQPRAEPPSGSAPSAGPSAGGSAGERPSRSEPDLRPYGTRAIEAAELEPWPNATPERDYLIEIRSPEFTCLCPRSGYPDFATVDVRYVPDETIVELRSLKLYLNAFRDRPVSHEGATNEILEDLVDLLDPRWLQVVADFYPRGNVHTVISVWHSKPGWSPGPDVAAAIGRGQQASTNASSSSGGPGEPGAAGSARTPQA